MVTIGSQASGDTGLKIWTSGLMRAVDRAATGRDAMPSGTAIERGDQEAQADRLQRW